MTDNDIREFFNLGEFIDLDAPRVNLEFQSYREVAIAYFKLWGAL
jgi:hypothetical protein